MRFPGPILRAGVLAALTSWSCAAPTVVTTIDRAEAGDSRARVARREAEDHWARRSEERELRAAIAGWRLAVELDDADAGAYADLARALFLLADNFAAKDEARRSFHEGAAAADRGLRALSPAIERLRNLGVDVDRAVAGAGVRAAPLVYWWALCTIRWAELDGWSTAAGTYEDVFRAMELVRSLDPEVDRGGPDRFFGSARAEAPAIAGGDLARSRQHFARALAIDATSLETRLQLARHYARRAGDTALYQRTLREIELLAAASPEDELAKKKARSLPAR